MKYKQRNCENTSDRLKAEFDCRFNYRALHAKVYMRLRNLNNDLSHSQNNILFSIEINERNR